MTSHALILLHKPQRHWHLILYFWCMRWPSRHLNKTYNPSWARATGISSRKRSAVQYYCNSTRISNNFLLSYTCIHWGIWKLTSSFNTVGPRHSISPNKQYKVLTSTPLSHPSSILSSCRKRGWNRVNCLPPSRKKFGPLRAICRPGYFLASLSRNLVYSRSNQLHYNSD